MTTSLTSFKNKKLSSSVITKILEHSLLKYFIVAVIALAIDTSVLLILVKGTNLSAELAVAVAFFVGACVSYLLSIKYVFKERRFKEKTATEILIFILIGIGSLFLTEVIIHVLYTMVHQSLAVAKIVSAAGTFFSNFIMRKIFLFTK